MLEYTIAAVAAVYLSLYLTKLRMTWSDFQIIAWVTINADPDEVPSGASVEAYARSLQVAGFVAAGISLIYLLPAVLWRERWSFFKKYDRMDIVKETLRSIHSEQ